MICDRDCKNCIFDDCINDEITEEERKLSDKLELQSKINKLDNRSVPKFLSSQKYRDKHKEENAIRVRACIKKKPAKYKKLQAKWRKAHKFQERDRNKLNYDKIKNTEHRKEQVREANRRYREKNKVEKVS